MEPTFVDKGPIRLVGILTVGEPDTIVPKLNEIWMDQFMPFDERLKPFSPDGAYYGAWRNNPMSYLAAMEVKDLAEIAEGLTEVILPAARYAVFECTVGTIGPTYDYAYGQWMPGSPYEYDMSAVDFEYYPAQTETKDSPTQVYIPVRLKQPQAA